MSHEASWEGCSVGSHRHLMRSGPHGKFVGHGRLVKPYGKVVLLAAIDIS